MGVQKNKPKPLYLQLQGFCRKYKRIFYYALLLLTSVNSEKTNMFLKVFTVDLNEASSLSGAHSYFYC